MSLPDGQKVWRHGLSFRHNTCIGQTDRRRDFTQQYCALHALNTDSRQKRALTIWGYYVIMVWTVSSNKQYTEQSSSPYCYRPLVHGGVLPQQQTGSAWSPFSVALGALGFAVTTSRHLFTIAEDADDTLFRIVRYSSHHLLHTLLPEHTNHPYHLRSKTHSFKLSSQHDERNFIDRMLFKNANPVCTQ